MSFKPVRYDRGKVMRLPLAASVTATKWALLKGNGSGYLTNAASGDNAVEFVALETVTESTGSAGGAYVDVLPIDDVTQFDATCATTPAQSNVFTHVDLSDAATLDLTASTDDIFYIEEVRDSGNKIVRGRFNKHAIQA